VKKKCDGGNKMSNVFGTTQGAILYVANVVQAKEKGITKPPFSGSVPSISNPSGASALIGATLGLGDGLTVMSSTNLLLEFIEHLLESENGIIRGTTGSGAKKEFRSDSVEIGELLESILSNKND
jgi:hypothetical protein